jgi:hypothetical protein
VGTVLLCREKKRLATIAPDVAVATNYRQWIRNDNARSHGSMRLARSLSKVVRQETSIVQNMTLLPESQRMQFWHEHFLPLEAQEKGLRARLLIVGQRTSPTEQ